MFGQNISSSSGHHYWQGKALSDRDYVYPQAVWRDGCLTLLLSGVQANNINCRIYLESLPVIREHSEEFGGSANDESEGRERRYRQVEYLKK